MRQTSPTTKPRVIFCPPSRCVRSGILGILGVVAQALCYTSVVFIAARPRSGAALAPFRQTLVSSLQVWKEDGASDAAAAGPAEAERTDDQAFWEQLVQSRCADRC
jgi:hypothetical protein